MRAGALRHRLTLQTQSRSSDGGGGATVTWADTATVWGSINSLSGTELYEAQKINPKLTHEIEIRYRSGISPKMRAKYGSRIFNIESVQNKDERNAMLRLVCEELVS